MSRTPRLARRVGGRYYEIDGERFWSVTTILEALPKPQLTRWAAKEAALWVVDFYEEIGGLVKGDPKAAVDVIKGAPWRSSKEKMELGSILHAVAEAHVLGLPLPEWPAEAEPYLRGFVAFLRDWQPKYEMAEATVANKTYRYAGTLDAIITVESFDLQRAGTFRLLLDIKTGSGIYHESALQLAAYRASEEVILPDGSAVQMPAVDGGVVLWLKPNGYELLPVRCDRYVFDVFLFVREVWRWTEQTSKRVIGEPVTPKKLPAKEKEKEEVGAPA